MKLDEMAKFSNPNHIDTYPGLLYILATTYKGSYDKNLSKLHDLTWFFFSFLSRTLQCPELLQGRKARICVMFAAHKASLAAIRHTIASASDDIPSSTAGIL